MVDPDKADKADRATLYESTLFANSTIFIFGALRTIFKIHLPFYLLGLAVQTNEIVS